MSQLEQSRHGDVFMAAEQKKQKCIYLVFSSEWELRKLKFDTAELEKKFIKVRKQQKNKHNNEAKGQSRRSLEKGWSKALTLAYKAGP